MAWKKLKVSNYLLQLLIWMVPAPALMDRILIISANKPALYSGRFGGAMKKSMQ